MTRETYEILDRVAEKHRLVVNMRTVPGEGWTLQIVLPNAGLIRTVGTDLDVLVTEAIENLKNQGLS